MTTCVKCNMQLPSDTEFCFECGARQTPSVASVPPPPAQTQNVSSARHPENLKDQRPGWRKLIYCSGCGTKNPLNYKFCVKCGVPTNSNNPLFHARENVADSACAEAPSLRQNPSDPKPVARSPAVVHTGENCVARIVTACLAVLILLLLGSGCGSRPDAQEQTEKTSSEAGSIADGVGIDMVFVQGGTFTMGCTPEQDRDCYKSERPAHQVTLSDFYIGKYEVTQAQWRAIMGGNPSQFKRDDSPVEQVNWDDIQEFIRRLNAKTGKNYRLPTEAEWEYAARGGKQTQRYKYSGSNNTDEVMWYDANSEHHMHPVGTKTANELGIHDMSGNVWELVNDYWDGTGAASQVDPKGPSAGSYRVARGGGWSFDARFARVSFRLDTDPGLRRNGFGFRLARSSN